MRTILEAKILPQILIGRLGKPQEIAGLIIYLCSDEVAFVTGANIAMAVSTCSNQLRRQSCSIFSLTVLLGNTMRACSIRY